ncbi:hypothetical protein D3C80_1764940 [compost metagenome]
MAQPLPETAGDQHFLALEIGRQLIEQRSTVAEGVADEHNIKLMLRPGPARIEHLRIHAERKVMNRARSERAVKLHTTQLMCKYMIIMQADD